MSWSGVSCAFESAVLPLTASSAALGFVARVVRRSRFEPGERKFGDQSSLSRGVDVSASFAAAAVNGQSLLSSHDFSTSASEGIFGPRPLFFVKVKPVGSNLGYVPPIDVIVGLQEEATGGYQAAMNQREKLGGHQSSVGSFGVVKRLRMIEVDLRDRCWRHMLLEELKGAAHRETGVMQASLVGSTRGVPNYQWEDVEPQHIGIGMTHGMRDGKPAVAAAEVQDDRGGTSKHRGPVDRAWRREFLEGGASPLLRWQDNARQGNA